MTDDPQPPSLGGSSPTVREGAFLGSHYTPSLTVALLPRLLRLCGGGGTTPMAWKS
jgi:hypothetical protein